MVWFPGVESLLTGLAEKKEKRFGRLISLLPFCHGGIDVQAPAVTVPTDDMFYSKEFPDRPDIAFLKNHFYREGRISEEQAIFILQKGTELLRKEPNLLEVDAPITGTMNPPPRLWIMLASNGMKVLFQGARH